MFVSASALAQNYDVDGDGDYDTDDWEAMQPPAPDQYDSQYAGETQPVEIPSQAQFEQQLSPYGAWYEEPGVGRVWQPAPAVVGNDFVPYTSGGSWAYTAAGWQFASTYRFPSYPYHYGRWYRSPRFGWVWQAGYQWAPHWVDWRCNSAGNVAWAPMAPRGYAVTWGVGAPSWSYAYGRYHRPNVQSFSWGRYNGGGWGRPSHFRRQNYNYNYTYQYNRGGNRGGGSRYHSANPVGGGGGQRRRQR
jgi:hypothetical protein